MIRWHLLAAGLVLACLLCYQLGGRALWTDEGYSLGSAAPLRDAVLSDASHPPGYQFLLHYWLHLVPQVARGSSVWPSASDGWLRAFCVPWALLAWWLAWLLASRLNLKREGLIAAWLMALSPLLLTYFRLGRYYSMAAALTMLCLLALVWLRERPSWGRALLAGLTVALAGYTDYPALALLLALLVILALVALIQRDFRRLGALVISGLAGMLLLLPLVLMTVHRTAVIAAISPDPMAHSLRGVIIKLGLPVFSLATGECIDPWRWTITIPALAVTALLLVAGMWALAREGGSPQPRWLIAVAWPLNIVVATAMLSTVAANVPPNRITSLTMLTVPLAYLVMARGITFLRPRALAAACLLVLLGAYAYGASNYFGQEQLLNQGYAPPWRQVAELIEQHEQPGDVIMSADDIFCRYYHGLATLADEKELRGTLEGRRPPTHRVWLITRDRGSQEMIDLVLRVRDRLVAQGARVQVFDVLPRTPQQQQMLTRILRRPAWDAYVKVYLLSPGEDKKGAGSP